MFEEDASLHSQKVSAAQFARYLKGINFPSDRGSLIRIAKSNGAPENVMEFFNRLPDKEYYRANDVEEEFGKLR